MRRRRRLRLRRTSLQTYRTLARADMASLFFIADRFWPVVVLGRENVLSSWPTCSVVCFTNRRDYAAQRRRKPYGYWMRMRKFKVDNLIDCRAAASDPSAQEAPVTRGRIAYLQQEDITCVNT
jgi:hypothetical protein